MPGPPALAIPCVVVAVLAATESTNAQERYRRDWSDHPGMPRQIWDIAHDDRGFLWLGGEQGLHRFDGQEVESWARDISPSVIHGLNRGPEGQIVAYTNEGPAYDVTPEGLEILTGPDGAAFGGLYDADYAADGSLWLCDESGLFRRSPVGEWLRFELPELEGQEVIRLRGAPDGGAFLGTLEGSFVRVHPDGTAETLMSDPAGGQVTRIAVKDEHTQAIGVRFGSNQGIYLVEDGNARRVFQDVEIGRRWTGLTFRDATLWVVTAREVVAISDDGRRIEVLGPSQGFHAGGEAVVDHERSLWLTSFRGIYQFTEPDVVLSTEMDGTRDVHRADSEIVVGRWQGPHRWDDNGGWQALTPDGYRIYDWGGVSPWGTTWFVGIEKPFTPQRRSVLLERRHSGWVHHLTREHSVFEGGYAIDESGVFWITFHDTLWRVNKDGATPTAIAPLAQGTMTINGLVVDGNRVIMIFRFGKYCEGILNPNHTALEGEWACEKIDGTTEMLDLQLVDGVPWVATMGRGVVQRNDDTWETIVGERELGTTMVRGLSLSPRGGVWVISVIGRVRVELNAEGVRVVERLGPWIGVPDWLMFGALEEADGTIWLSGMTSPVRIPAHTRQRPIEPPRVFVTGFSADGRDISPDTAQVLPATTRRIELSWAAPAFRDPASLRYEVRADSAGDWAPTRESSFRFMDLGPGDYRIEVRASLDGENWSEAPADIRFAIRSPLWQRPTFWAAMLAVAAIGALLVQWQRTRQQIRLERQRTGIAMNLHDELGAGLASIGLLTDLAAGDEMEPKENREVVGRVGEISRSLSRSLSDIVWTLRPKSVDLPGFALFLRQRAADMLSAGDTVVEFDFPKPVPPIRLQLEVRRQIHAIASEALHNAAKHSRASKVRVGLEHDGDVWILRIADDGIGFGDDLGGDGLGLESMSKRADTIGANLLIDAKKDAGCRLELRFSPRVEG